jgi:uncharacterized protein
MFRSILRTFALKAFRAGRPLAGLAAAVLLPCDASTAGAQTGLPQDIVHAIRKAYGDDEMRYFDRAVDLDGDGKPELVVYVVGPMVCGSGGCDLLVFTPAGAGYRRVASISVTQVPIRASSAKSSGWRDLVVRIGGGGGRSGDVALAFDGKTYPRNPTVPGPRVKPAGAADTELLIAEFKSMDEGKVLPAARTAPNAAASTGAGPSFDCAKADKPIEKLVCGDAALAALDRVLAAAYAKGLSPSSEWTERDRNASRAAQREWLAERDACAKAADPKGCTTSAYQRRIAVLKIQNADAGPVPSAVSYRCAGLESQPVTAVYYNGTEPKSAVVTVGDRQVVAFIAPAASGARYTAKDVELWEHQGEATLRWNEKGYRCKVQ